MTVVPYSFIQFVEVDSQLFYGYSPVEKHPFDHIGQFVKLPRSNRLIFVPKSNEIEFFSLELSVFSKSGELKEEVSETENFLLSGRG